MQSASAALIPASSIARTRSARSLTTAARASKLGPSDGQWGLVILAVPIGTLLAFDAPDSAHYAYRRTLTCGPTGCGSASHHTIGSTVHLSGRSPRPHNPVWAAPEPAALPTPSHALTVWRALRGRRELAARLLRRLTRSADYAGRSRRYVWWSRCSPEPLPK
jgi:hypothetical protein